MNEAASEIGNDDAALITHYGGLSVAPEARAASPSRNSLSISSDPRSTRGSIVLRGAVRYVRGQLRRCETSIVSNPSDQSHKHWLA
jgi:hypothetical protein